jgi:formylglycine-generating enzyme required for sulfatase activity
VLLDYAWFHANSSRTTHPVGRLRPNAFGLYDMHGNVREWVLDFYSPKAYAGNAKGEPAMSPEGPAQGTVHVARGGDYDSAAEELRCAARGFEEDWWVFEDPNDPRSKWWLPKRPFIGFRVVFEIGEK